MAKEPEVKTVIREFTRPLTEIEIAEKGKELADKVREYDQVDNERKDVSRDYGDQLKALDAVIQKLAKEVKEGNQIHEVPCYERPNYVDKAVEAVNEETGDVLDSRPMTEEEKQMPMWPAGKKEDDGEDGGEPDKGLISKGGVE
jgi:hypothetical protein